jgi:hypothetical protein
MSIQQLLDIPFRTFIYTTGCGAGIQNKLWKLPGCSSFLAGCGFPYAPELTSEVIGYTPSKFVSKETAIELAMSAYMKAFDASKSDMNVIGIGLSGSVASAIEHRGDHRLYVAAVHNKGCDVTYVKLSKGSGAIKREEDGDISNSLILKTLYGVLGLEDKMMFKWSYQGSCYTPEIELSEESELLYSLIQERPFFKSDGSKCSSPEFFSGEDYSNYVFYPGSFNPLHYGHLNAKKAAFNAAVHLNNDIKDTIFTTCVNPPHKNKLSSVEILQRIKQMRGQNFLLTWDDPYYTHKAKMFPGSNIIIGTDVLLSIFDPKWNLDPIEMLNSFKENRVRFLVRGRLIDGKFISLADCRAQIKLLNDNNYYNLFAHVDGRDDISSTELRNKK